MHASLRGPDKKVWWLPSRITRLNWNRKQEIYGNEINFWTGGAPVKSASPTPRELRQTVRCLELYYRQSRSQKDIARSLGVSAATVSRLLKRAFDEGQRTVCRSRSEEHTSELQSRPHLVCRLLLE